MGASTGCPETLKNALFKEFVEIASSGPFRDSCKLLIFPICNPAPLLHIKHRLYLPFVKPKRLQAFRRISEPPPLEAPLLRFSGPHNAKRKDLKHFYTTISGGFSQGLIQSGQREPQTHSQIQIGRVINTQSFLSGQK